MDDQQKWHSVRTEEVLRRLNTSLEGLAGTAVEDQRQAFGSNRLPPPRQRTALATFLDQFKSALIYILVVAGAVSLFLREWQDAIVIFGVVLLNAIIGYRQERQSNAAVMRLLQMSQQIVRVVRGGIELQIEADDLVVGDVVVISAGDTIPADGRWVEALNLRVNEAALTGESVPVSKIAEALPEETEVGERKNMAWRGTGAVAGRGQLVVTHVGAKTRFGSIVANLQARTPEMTPFQRKLASFSRRLAIITLFLGALVFAIGLLRQIPLQEMFLITVSLIVSIVPEGLPVVITMAMAWGMWEMAKRKALVRKLVAVETLGAVTVVATDKTGTLTYGEMMTERLWIDHQSYHFTGQGYAPVGDILLGGERILGREHEGLSWALRLGAMNNDARFSMTAEGERQAIGDPTELALVVAAGKAGWSKHDLDMAHPRLGEFPFDYHKKYMVTWHRHSKTETLVVVKGAPREVLKLCQGRWTMDGTRPLGDSDRAAVLEVYERWAEDALRGLAIAYVVVPTEGFDATGALTSLTFVGLFGIADALRPEAPDAVKAMQGAGIRVIMLTGDYQKTGVAVGQRLGLLKDPSPERLLDGSEIEELTESQLRQRLAHASIGTRLTPEHKLKMAKLLKQDGEIVAMTGDGINDVPTLVEADVGVAVGQSSSDAAKEASDIVLVDGNFQSITAAIAEGRRIFRNIRRVMFYLLASNIGELVLVMGALLIGLPVPLLPKQIIWLNAITDPFLGIALAREPRSPSVMREHPHNPLASIVTPQMWQRILTTAGVIAAGSIAVFVWANASGRDSREVYAVTLTTVALGQWLTALNARSSLRSIFSSYSRNTSMLVAFVTVLLMQAAILYIPFLADLFDVWPLSPTDWLIALAGSIPVVIVDETRKWFVRRHYRPSSLTTDR